MISSHVYNNPKWVIDIEYQHYDDKNHKIGILSHISSQVLSLPIKWDEFKSQPTISTIEEVQQVVTKYVWRSLWRIEWGQEYGFHEFPPQVKNWENLWFYPNYLIDTMSYKQLLYTHAHYSSIENTCLSNIIHVTLLSTGAPLENVMFPKMEMQNVLSFSIFSSTWYTYIKCKGTLFLFLVIIISLDEMVFKLYCKLGLFLRFSWYKQDKIYRQQRKSRGIRCNY